MALRPLTVPLFTAFLLAMPMITGCGGPASEPSRQVPGDGAAVPRFLVLPGDSTGLTLRNDLRESPEMNYFAYPYLYHSGGVAIGDVDGDGLPDVYLTTNRNGSRLYRNLGGLRFTDITDQAGVGTGDRWCTGPSMVDLNADGHLDIHVCVGGPPADPERLRGLVFVNNGDGTFTERGAELGLALPMHALQAYHADVDGDLDLDAFIVATRTDFENNTKVARYTVGPRSNTSHRLMVNDGTGHFTDHTEKAGLLSHAWGLSAVLADLDGDERRDIYVAHDFLEPDAVKLNTGAGPFAEAGTRTLRHTSMYSMGADMADIDNDGLDDLYVLDMTPPEHQRSKQNMASMRPRQFFGMVALGWNHQYMANVLQLNNGGGSFSDIAHLAGVDRTDWSWAPLIADLDNDGWKDLFVSNGVWRDITNNDFKNTLEQLTASRGAQLPFNEVMALIPTDRPENYMFRNRGDLTFEKAMAPWGYHHKSVSTGAAYGDLDADGDLDLVVCDVGEAPKVVRNLTRELNGGGWLQLVLEGIAPNTRAIGARVTLHAGSMRQVVEQRLERGFQGSVEPLVHFGLGTAQVDSVLIDWPDGTRSVLREVAVNARTTVDMATVPRGPRRVPPGEHTWFSEQAGTLGLDHEHVESSFDDFASEILLPHRQSDHGPALAIGDVNGDGAEDVFVGASKGNAGCLYLQGRDGRFRKAGPQPWAAHNDQELIGALFFDADGDGDPDLYTAAGSTESGPAGAAYQDHLYRNEGGGTFSEAKDALPVMPGSTQRVAAADVDGDTDLDLFVGGRNEPGAYPAAPRSFLLMNDGSGRFTDATADRAPLLDRVGMVTDALFHDLDGNGDPDLLLCGEWMAVRLFLNDGGRFTDGTGTWLDSTRVGWWNDLELADLDGDGDMDLLAGNIGLNNKFHPSKEKPLEIYMDDLDGTGTTDIVLAKHGAGGACFPVRGRECSSEQMPFLKERFGTYKAFSEADLDVLYGREKLARALHYSATEFATLLLRNEGGRFQAVPLPNEAQTAPWRGTVVMDVNGDGHADLVGAGNRWGAEVETSRYDAGNGWVLLGDGRMGFTPVPHRRSGLRAEGHACAVAPLQVNGRPAVVVANGDGPLQVFVHTPPVPAGAVAQR
ncbi:MAG TPA: VCBS repeat-containing protein [Flavobacteriales bacterium]|nr:VCBS repeat-containing protein [Flavobacteriales bacterium]HMR26304.1 VCBS repeat-containing protein [Flavobacteriales bacterium]